MNCVRSLTDSRIGMQLHDGFKKLNVRPSIELSPEDFDEFSCNG